MERSNGASGTKRLVAFARNDDRGSVVTLDDTSSRDSDDAAMPSVTIDDDAVGIA